jgi:hypothetical protein
MFLISVIAGRLRRCQKINSRKSKSKNQNGISIKEVLFADLAESEAEPLSIQFSPCRKCAASLNSDQKCNFTCKLARKKQDFLKRFSVSF